MNALLDKKCVPCEGGVPALARFEVEELMPGVPGWSHVNHGKIHKHYAFKDFVSALAFVNRVGALAEAEGHHPDVHLTWGAVDIELWTHAIHGLSENDFILAAKIDARCAP